MLRPFLKMEKFATFCSISSVVDSVLEWDLISKRVSLCSVVKRHRNVPSAGLLSNDWIKTCKASCSCRSAFNKSFRDCVEANTCGDVSHWSLVRQIVLKPYTNEINVHPSKSQEISVVIFKSFGGSLLATPWFEVRFEMIQVRILCPWRERAFITASRLDNLSSFDWP